MGNRVNLDDVIKQAKATPISIDLAFKKVDKVNIRLEEGDYAQKAILSAHGIPPGMLGRKTDGKMGFIETPTPKERALSDKNIGFYPPPVHDVLFTQNSIKEGKKTPLLKDLKSGQKFKFERYGALCVFGNYTGGKVFYRNLKLKKEVETSEINQSVIFQ